MNAPAALILEVIGWDAATPEPDSWGGERAEARDALRALVAERDRLHAALERIAADRHTWSEADFEEAQRIAREALAGSGGDTTNG